MYMRCLPCSYLKHCYDSVKELSSQSAVTGYKQNVTSSKLVSSEFERFSSLVKRCLQSTPCRYPAPCNSNSSYWLDYSFHCDVIDAYVRCLAPDERLEAYEELTRLQPDNLQLVVR